MLKKKVFFILFAVCILAFIAYTFADDITLTTLLPEGSGTCLWEEKNENIHNVNTGNVGIGTDTPLGLLHVQGSETDTNVYFESGAVLGNHKMEVNIFGGSSSMFSVAAGSFLQSKVSISGSGLQDPSSGVIIYFDETDLELKCKRRSDEKTAVLTQGKWQ
jgi:hypothetical protein